MSQFLRRTMIRRYLSTQLDTLSTLGYPTESALALLKLSAPQLLHPRKRISIDAVEVVYENAAEVLGDPYIALRVGAEFRVPNFSQTGRLYGYCRDLAQVMDMNSKYQKLAVDAANISHDIEDGRHFFSLNSYEGRKRRRTY